MANITKLTAKNMKVLSVEGKGVMIPRDIQEDIISRSDQIEVWQWSDNGLTLKFIGEEEIFFPMLGG